MDSVNYHYHTFAGYILFPLRLTLFITTTIALCSSVYVLDMLRCNKIATSLAFNCVKLSTKVFGLTIHVDGQEYITDKPCIIVSNHINICDHFVTIVIMNRVNPYIVSNKFNIIPFSKLFNSMKCIYTEPKKGYVVEKMKERIKQGSQVTLYPDGCNPIPSGKLISPFRNGAFVPKAPILPIVIRYVPSSNTNMNWYYEDSSRDNTPFSLLKSYLQDGSIEVYVKVLPLQKYKDSYKSHEDYRDDIYNLMTRELSTLPKQEPNLVVGKSSLDHTMKCLLLVPFTLAFICHCIGFYHQSVLMYCGFIVGYFCHFYPTKNTIFIDMLNVPYSCYASSYISLDIPERYIIYDYYVRCMYIAIMCVSCLSFYRSRLGTNYTEKEHLMKVWVPGYSIAVYNIVIYIGINLF